MGGLLRPDKKTKTWPGRLKVIEFGIGLGAAVILGWMPLTLLSLTAIDSLGFEPGTTTRILVTAAQGLALLVCCGLAGALAGALLTEGRWVFSITVASIAIAFQLAVDLISASPTPLWRGAVELIGLICSTAGTVLFTSWIFSVFQRLVSKKVHP
jgi:hypothetical protein